MYTSYYSQYQWATCLTDAYIRQKSNRRHQCRDSAVRCWQQCQLEINDQECGAVYSNCRCSINGPTAPNPCPDLNQDCHSPDGTSCTWYRNCLEQCYPCEGTGDGYAIEFAEKFCNLYTNSFNTFSFSGQRWIDGVRRCLQVTLVHSLRPFVEKDLANHYNQGITRDHLFSRFKESRLIKTLPTNFFSRPAIIGVLCSTMIFTSQQSTRVVTVVVAPRGVSMTARTLAWLFSG